MALVIEIWLITRGVQEVWKNKQLQKHFGVNILYFRWYTLSPLLCDHGMPSQSHMSISLIVLPSYNVR